MPPRKSSSSMRNAATGSRAVAVRKGSIRTTRILTCLPSPNRERDWGIQAATGAGAVAAQRAQIPTKVDLRDDKWWPIGNQENTGSCVGWATADGVLRWHFTTAGRIAKGDQLSVRYLWM